MAPFNTMTHGECSRMRAEGGMQEERDGLNSQLATDPSLFAGLPHAHTLSIVKL